MRAWMAVVLATVLYGTAPGAEPLVRRFELPGLGVLALRVAADWRVETRRPAGANLPPSYVLLPTAGVPFKVMFTGLGPARPADPPPQDEEIRQRVERLAEGVKAKAVEPAYTLREFRENGVFGCYFTLTDRAPKPGEFVVMTQGMARVGPLVLIFSIFTNPGQQGLIDQALAMLRGVRFLPVRLPAPGA